MICNKCGTIYPDNGTCPNCPSNGGFFKTAGSLDDSMDMSAPVSYPGSEPTPCNEPAYTPSASDNDYMKTMPYNNIEMNIETTVADTATTSIDTPTWNASPSTEAYNPPPSAPYVATAYTSAPPSSPEISAPVKTSKPSYIAHIVISALIMAIMLFVPIITDGGLIPDKDSHSLIDIFEIITENSSFIPGETLVILYLIVLATLMSITSFIGSCTKVKPLCIVSSIIGYVSLTIVAVIMALRVLFIFEDFKYLIKAFFDTKEAMFTIFFWVAIVLFLVHFIVSCATRSRK